MRNKITFTTDDTLHKYAFTHYENDRKAFEEEFTISEFDATSWLLSFLTANQFDYLCENDFNNKVISRKAYEKAMQYMKDNTFISLRREVVSYI